MFVRLILLVCAAVSISAGITKEAQAQSNTGDLSANDVSILFPAPRNLTDLQSQIISLAEFDDDRVLPETLFQQTIELVTGPSTLTTPNGVLTVDAGAIPGTTRRINFPSQNIRAGWFLAGVRIDPGAPGLTKDIFNSFGKSPQIRLILQPIERIGDQVRVTDGSLHLVYAFHSPDDPDAQNCLLHNTPDMVAFKEVVDDLLAIKDRMQTNHNVLTNTKPLGIHPAFSPNVSPSVGFAFKEEIKSFLNEHLTTERLFAVSVAGIPLPAPEPWVFVAMQLSPFSGNMEAVPSPAIEQPGPMPNFGQMISFIDRPQIVPTPATRNLQPIDCRMNSVGAVPQQVPGAGVSTSPAFDFGATNIGEIASVIADPTRSHFFNTDCVSCHTETRKPIDMGHSASFLAFEAGIDPDVLPKERWNVRAFGWFPGFFLSGGPFETVTRRTATETHEVIECFHNGNWDSVDQSCLP